MPRHACVCCCIWTCLPVLCCKIGARAEEICRPCQRVMPAHAATRVFPATTTAFNPFFCPISLLVPPSCCCCSRVTMMTVRYNMPRPPAPPLPPSRFPRVSCFQSNCRCNKSKQHVVLAVLFIILGRRHTYCMYIFAVLNTSRPRLPSPVCRRPRALCDISPGFVAFEDCRVFPFCLVAPSWLLCGRMAPLMSRRATAAAVPLLIVSLHEACVMPPPLRRVSASFDAPRAYPAFVLSF